MQKLFAKIIQILDGTPTEQGKRQSGQSLVELALVMPILLILLSGMVEIGWFANNYLTLLDVTRAGARRAATLPQTASPLVWDNRGSYMPIEMLSAEQQAQRIGYMAYSGDPYGNISITANAIADRELFYRAQYRSSYGLVGKAYGSDACGTISQQNGFYTDVACTMIDTLEPLQLSRENGVDDIIVSAFSLEAVDNGDLLGTNRPIDGNVPQMVVVGRYPTNANECDAVETAPGSGDYTASMDPRDPFDFNENLRIDRWTSTTNDPSVVFPFVWNDIFSEVYPGYDDNQVDVNLSEKQVGFVWFGHHQAVLDAPSGELQTLCLGSEWSIADVEQMLNLTDYVTVSQTAERQMLAGTGLVLAEIYWRHEMLLKIPVFNPVYGMFSPDGKPPTIYVWAAFPLPSVAPNIVFH